MYTVHQHSLRAGECSLLTASQARFDQIDAATNVPRLRIHRAEATRSQRDSPDAAAVENDDDDAINSCEAISTD
jgi:hypothetical protein